MAGGGISETPNQDEENSGGENDSDVEEDPDKEADSNAVYFYLRVGTVVRTGSGSNDYTVTSYNGSSYGYIFNVYWYDENGNSQTWGKAPTKNGSTSVDKDTSSAISCGSFYYQYDNTGVLGIGQVKRMGKVERYSSAGGYGYIVVGASTSSTFSNSDYQYSSQQDISYWHYGTNWSTSQPSASSVTTSSSSTTLYVYARKSYSYYFYFYPSTSGVQIYTIGAGLTLTAPDGSYYSRPGYTLTGWSETGELDDSSNYYQGGDLAFSVGTAIAASYANQNRTFYPVWTANTYKITYNSNYGTATTKTQIVTYASSFTTQQYNAFSRTGYTIVGWSTSSSDIDKGNYTKVGTSYTYIDTENITLYAQWEINTYTLTVNYYGGTARQTNATNLNVTASSCNPSSTVALSSDKTQEFTHTYSTTACTITLARVNTSYSYYIAINDTPTTSSSLNSTTYSWTPTGNSTINVYVYQRYMISYNLNNGTGTLPSSQYKVHGTDVTLGTNSLTRTSYRANGWNTAKDKSGTSYTDGQAYKSDASVTLYANWTASYAVIAVRIKTSSNGVAYANSVAGGTATISYKIDLNNTITSSTRTVNTSSLTSVSQLIEQTATITGTAKDGYVYVGVSASSVTEPPGNPNSLSVVPTTKGQTYTYYVYFVKISNNQLKYQSQYTVTDVDGTNNYGFAKNSSGYWESQNQQMANSYSLAKVEFTLSKTCDITFKIINYAETSYDFGIFSNLDTTLTASYSVDSTNVYKSFKGSSSANVVDLTYSNVSAGEHYIYVKFRKDGSNNSYNDSLQFKLVADGLPNSYFYFEDGEYPQSYVGDEMNETLINNVSTISSYLQYIDGEDDSATIPIYEYQGKRYACIRPRQTAEVTLNDGTLQLFDEDSNYFFVVEPIRWRVSDYGVDSTDENWGKYGTYKTNFTAVSDKILTFSSVSTTDEMNDLVSEWWRFVDSNLYYAISESANAYSATNFIELTYKNLTEQDYEYDYFGPPGQQDKVLTETNTEAVLRVASIDEIQQDLTDMRASASDFVCAYLGVSADKYCDYWTRNLGQYLQNGKMITSYGMEKSTWLNKLGGVRFSITFAEGSRLI